MKTPSYEEYRANPEFRDLIDREVQRMRAEAVEQFIYAPIKAWLAQLRRPRMSVKLVTRTA